MLVAGARVHYRRAGGGPALVLLHVGGLDSPRLTQPLAGARTLGSLLRRPGTVTEALAEEVAAQITRFLRPPPEPGVHDRAAWVGCRHGS